jgi:putative nucleotidyltransferase with HDIG domain
MIATLIFSSIEVSLLVTLAVAVSVAAFSRQPMQLIIMYLSSSILAAKLSQGARKRTTIIQAGIAIGVIQAVIAALTSPAAKNFPIELLYFFINGVASSVILLGILPIFEYLFKGLTNISLLELADFHHPLLELLIQDAPGTYHHSLIVGNLSESAAKAIGANSLLTRVGAYYHDVGKLLKPQYFSENQDKNGSRHEGLSAAMSKLVIMNHVKEGAELARRYRLNPVLIDFIEQHHGKSLVYYFYRRALESPEEDQEVKEEGFRYPGPKPDSKETAIVLLADSVEAAARAANNPDSAKIEGLVHKVINNKFIDGQLDECELTLKDLEKISAIFTKLLCGIYHSRANYPEKTGDA